MDGRINVTLHGDKMVSIYGEKLQNQKFHFCIVTQIWCISVLLSYHQTWARA